MARIIYARVEFVKQNLFHAVLVPKSALELILMALPMPTHCQEIKTP